MTGAEEPRSAPRKARGRPGDGGVYEIADGTWRGSVDLGRNPVTGKRDRKTVRGKSRVEVRRKVTALRDRHRAGDPTVAPGAAGAGLTVGGWLDLWLDGPARAKVREDTWRRYKGIVEMQIKPALGRIALTNLTPERVESLYADLAMQPRSASDARPLADATILQVHRVLARAMKVAHRRQYVSRDVLRLVEPPKIDQAKESRPLTAMEGRRLLALCAEDRLYARWALALGTGSRQAEVLGLTWDAIDFQSNTVTLRRQLKRRPWQHGCSPAGQDPTCAGETAVSCPQRHGGGLHLVEHTKGRPRTLPMPPFIEEALRTRKRVQAEERLAAGALWDDAGIPGLVFTSALGAPIDARKDHRDWQALLVAAKVPKARLHDARHATATILTAAGVDSVVIAALLGHSSTAVTAIYQHVNAEIARPASDALQEAFAGPVTPQAPSGRVPALPRRPGSVRHAD